MAWLLKYLLMDSEVDLAKLNGKESVWEKLTRPSGNEEQEK